MYPCPMPFVYGILIYCLNTPNKNQVKCQPCMDAVNIDSSSFPCHYTYLYRYNVSIYICMYVYIIYIYVHLYASLAKWLSNLGNSSAKTWSDGPLIPNGSELAIFTLKLVILPYIPNFFIPLSHLNLVDLYLVITCYNLLS
jgi:hypothetical protein